MTTLARALDPLFTELRELLGERFSTSEGGAPAAR